MKQVEIKSGVESGLSLPGMIDTHSCDVYQTRNRSQIKYKNPAVEAQKASKFSLGPVDVIASIKRTASDNRVSNDFPLECTGKRIDQTTHEST